MATEKVTDKIRFRCWYCNKRYAVARPRIGEQMLCSCKQELRIPARNNGSSKIRKLSDWLVETIVYGGGGFVIGLVLAIFLISQLRFIPFIPRRPLLIWLPLIGFLIGFLGGERAITWLGRKIRERETT